MSTRAFAALVALLAIPGLSAAQATADDPEQAMRDFMYALYANDASDYRGRIIPEPESEVLIGSQTFTREQLDQLKKDTSGLQVRRMAPPSLDGAPLPDSTAVFPVGAKLVYFTQFRGVVTAVPMQRTADGWKVDVRFWLAMRRQMNVPPRITDPEMVAKGFLFHVLAKKPEALSQFASQSINGEDYTSANNLPPGDLDQILSLCVEMPIVRARPGERVLLPSGEVAVGSVEGESLLLIGLMGPVEVPFLMRRNAGAWKVVPQKYFEMLRQAGGV